jgi:hypothetical protein
MTHRTRVRISISRDRQTTAEHELREYAIEVGAGHPFRQGTTNDLIWEFCSNDQRERATLFAVNARNTPGVHVYEPQRLTYAGAEVKP